MTASGSRTYLSEGSVDGWAVAIHGLFYSYGRHQVLFDVDLVARCGRLTCLLGPNGAGKTTLVHCLVGMLAPNAGVIELPAGESRRDRFGFVYDDLPLPLSLTGAEVLALLKATHSTWDDALVSDLVDVLGLAPAMNRLLATYSHGMKRKVQLIASLGHRPSIWVLDEPFRGLDPVATAVLGVLIRQFKADDGAVILATHDLLAAERIADDVAIIASGRVVRAGTVAELVGPSASLQDVYLESTGLIADVETATEAIRSLDLAAYRQVDTRDGGGRQ
jgi:ABC-2 type transport system ATP-binding protein